MVKPPATDAAVKRATGRDWAAWRRVLDAAGARKLTHAEIVRMVHDRFEAGDSSTTAGSPRTPSNPGWWSQMVTVGYERLSGLRLAHQRPSGFEISKSKTVAAPIARVFAAWHTPARRQRWLADPGIEIRSATAPTSVRFVSIDGKTRGDVRLTAKGTKTSVTVTHGRIASAKAAEKLKKYWNDQLAALNAQFLARDATSVLPDP